MGDGHIAIDRPLVGRQGQIGLHMRHAARHGDIGFKSGADRADPGRQRQAGFRRHHGQAGDFVEYGDMGIAHREALQRGGAGAFGLDHVIETLEDIVLAPVAFRAQPDAALLHMHQRQAHPHQGDALDHELAPQERRRRQVDIGLGGFGHHQAVLVQHPGTQHHQIDAPFVPAPFDGGLVIFQGDAGQSPLDGVGQRPRQGTQRDRAHQQADARPDHKEHDRGHQHADAERGAADVMGLHIVGKRQLQRGLPRSRARYRACRA